MENGNLKLLFDMHMKYASVLTLFEVINYLDGK